MVKSNELRIGNLLTYDNDLLKVNLLSNVGYPYDINCDILEKNIIDFNTNRIGAIPLTEEWLLKFGFKYWEDLDQWYSPDDNAELRINHWTKGHEIGFFEDAYHIELKYVHQLQNLYFALTNEELKIIN